MKSQKLLINPFLKSDPICVQGFELLRMDKNFDTKWDIGKKRIDMYAKFEYSLPKFWAFLYQTLLMWCHSRTMNGETPDAL